MPYIMIRNKREWVEDEDFQPSFSPLTKEQQIISTTREIREATQKRLDSFAHTREYDSMLSACGYFNDPDAEFKADGLYCVAARSATWAKIKAIRKEAEAGTRPAPGGYGEIESELPVLAWPE